MVLGTKMAEDSLPWSSLLSVWMIQHRRQLCVITKRKEEKVTFGSLPLHLCDFHSVVLEDVEEVVAEGRDLLLEFVDVVLGNWCLLVLALLTGHVSPDQAFHHVLKRIACLLTLHGFCRSNHLIFQLFLLRRKPFVSEVYLKRWTIPREVAHFATLLFCVECI